MIEVRVLETGELLGTANIDAEIYKHEIYRFIKRVKITVPYPFDVKLTDTMTIEHVPARFSTLSFYFSGDCIYGHRICLVDKIEDAEWLPGFIALPRKLDKPARRIKGY